MSALSLGKVKFSTTEPLHFQIHTYFELEEKGIQTISFGSASFVSSSRLLRHTQWICTAQMMMMMLCEESDGIVGS